MYHSCVMSGLRNSRSNEVVEAGAIFVGRSGFPPNCLRLNLRARERCHYAGARGACGTIDVTEIIQQQCRLLGVRNAVQRTIINAWSPRDLPLRDTFVHPYKPRHTMLATDEISIIAKGEKLISSRPSSS